MILGLSCGAEAAWLELCWVPSRVPVLGELGRGAQQESGDISVLTLHGQSAPTKPHLQDMLPPLNSLCSDDRKYVCH